MSRKRKSNIGVVYSTEEGKICPACGHPQRRCSCKQVQCFSKGDGIVRISRQTKGRKGKGVTLINGLPLAPSELKTMAKQLKQKCGTGGTVKSDVIEIQGDHRRQLKDFLTEQGYTVKLAGG